MLQSVLTSLFLTYAKKYINGIEADLKNLSLWGGDLVLENLDLNLSALEKALKLPSNLRLRRAFVQQLRISIPWASLTSVSVSVSLSSVKLDLSIEETPSKSNSFPDSEAKVVDSQLQAEIEKETKQGWVQDLLMSITANIKVVMDDFEVCITAPSENTFLRFHIGTLAVESADTFWNNAFCPLETPWKLLRKILIVERASLTVGNALDGFHRPLFADFHLSVRAQIYLLPSKQSTVLSQREIGPKSTIDIQIPHESHISVTSTHLLCISTLLSALQQTSAETSAPILRSPSLDVECLSEPSKAKMGWSHWAMGFMSKVTPSKDLELPTTVAQQFQMERPLEVSTVLFSLSVVYIHLINEVSTCPFESEEEFICVAVEGLDVQWVYGSSGDHSLLSVHLDRLIAFNQTHQQSAPLLILSRPELMDLNLHFKSTQQADEQWETYCSEGSLRFVQFTERKHWTPPVNPEELRLHPAIVVKDSRRPPGLALCTGTRSDDPRCVQVSLFVHSVGVLCDFGCSGGVDGVLRETAHFVSCFSGKDGNANDRKEKERWVDLYVSVYDMFLLNHLSDFSHFSRDVLYDPTYNGFSVRAFKFDLHAEVQHFMGFEPFLWVSSQLYALKTSLTRAVLYEYTWIVENELCPSFKGFGGNTDVISVYNVGLDCEMPIRVLDQLRNNVTVLQDITGSFEISVTSVELYVSLPVIHFLYLSYTSLLKCSVFSSTFDESVIEKAVQSRPRPSPTALNSLSFQMTQWSISSFKMTLKPLALTDGSISVPFAISVETVSSVSSNCFFTVTGEFHQKPNDRSFTLQTTVSPFECFWTSEIDDMVTVVSSLVGSSESREKSESDSIRMRVELEIGQIRVQCDWSRINRIKSDAVVVVGLPEVSLQCDTESRGLTVDLSISNLFVTSDGYQCVSIPLVKVAVDGSDVFLSIPRIDAEIVEFLTVLAVQLGKQRPEEPKENTIAKTKSVPLNLTLTSDSVNCSIEFVNKQKIVLFSRSLSIQVRKNEQIDYISIDWSLCESNFHENTNTRRIISIKALKCVFEDAQLNCNWNSIELCIHKQLIEYLLLSSVSSNPSPPAQTSTPLKLIGVSIQWNVLLLSIASSDSHFETTARLDDCEITSIPQINALLYQIECKVLQVSEKVDVISPISIALTVSVSFDGLSMQVHSSLPDLKVSIEKRWLLQLIEFLEIFPQSNSSPNHSSRSKETVNVLFDVKVASLLVELSDFETNCCLKVITRGWRGHKQFNENNYSLDCIASHFNTKESEITVVSVEASENAVSFQSSESTGLARIAAFDVCVPLSLLTFLIHFFPKREMNSPVDKENSSERFSQFTFKLLNSGGRLSALEDTGDGLALSWKDLFVSSCDDGKLRSQSVVLQRLQVTSFPSEFRIVHPFTLNVSYVTEESTGNLQLSLESVNVSLSKGLLHRLSQMSQSFASLFPSKQSSPLSTVETPLHTVSRLTDGSVNTFHWKYPNPVVLCRNSMKGELYSFDPIENQWTSICSEEKCIQGTKFKFVSGNDSFHSLLYYTTPLKRIDFAVDIENICLTVFSDTFLSPLVREGVVEVKCTRIQSKGSLWSLRTLKPAITASFEGEITCYIYDPSDFTLIPFVFPSRLEMDCTLTGDLIPYELLQRQSDDVSVSIDKIAVFLDFDCVRALRYLTTSLLTDSYRKHVLVNRLGVDLVLLRRGEGIPLSNGESTRFHFESVRNRQITVEFDFERVEIDVSLYFDKTDTIHTHRGLVYISCTIDVDGTVRVHLFPTLTVLNKLEIPLDISLSPSAPQFHCEKEESVTFLTANIPSHLFILTNPPIELEISDSLFQLDSFHIRQTHHSTPSPTVTFSPALTICNKTLFTLHFSIDSHSLSLERDETLQWSQSNPSAFSLQLNDISRSIQFQSTPTLFSFGTIFAVCSDRTLSQIDWVSPSEIRNQTDLSLSLLHFETLTALPPHSEQSLFSQLDYNYCLQLGDTISNPFQLENGYFTVEFHCKPVPLAVVVSIGCQSIQIFENHRIVLTPPVTLVNRLMDTVEVILTDPNPLTLFPMDELNIYQLKDISLQLKLENFQWSDPIAVPLKEQRLRFIYRKESPLCLTLIVTRKDSQFCLLLEKDEHPPFILQNQTETVLYTKQTQIYTVNPLQSIPLVSDGSQDVFETYLFAKTIPSVVLLLSTDAFQWTPLQIWFMHEMNLQWNNFTVRTFLSNGTTVISVLDDRPIACKPMTHSMYSLRVRNVTVFLDSIELMQRKPLLSLSLGEIRLQQTFVNAKELIQSFDMSIGSVRMENYLDHCVFPVVLYNLTDSTFSTHFVISPFDFNPFEIISITISPLAVNVDDHFIHRISQTIHSLTPSSPSKPLKTAPKLFIRNFHISSIPLRLNLMTGRTLNLSAHNITLTLSAHSFSPLFCSTDRLVKELIAGYVADILLTSPILLGSLDLIGNPSLFALRMGRGLSDLILIPSRAFGDGWGSFAVAVGLGFKSLLQNVSEGTLTSVSGFSNSLSRHLEQLTDQDLYSLQRTASRAFHADSFSGGLGHGFRAFANGLLGGLVGAVEAPLHGAVDNGVKGFVWGLGQGFAGVVTKPVGGALDLITHTSRGLVSVISKDVSVGMYWENEDLLDLFVDRSMFALNVFSPVYLGLLVGDVLSDAFIGTDGIEDVLIATSAEFMYILHPQYDRLITSFSLDSVQITLSAMDTLVLSCEAFSIPFISDPKSIHRLLSI